MPRSRAKPERHERPLWWPLEDRLLDIEEAATLCKVPVTRWERYWPSWPALVDGMRVVRANDPRGRGCRRWLLSATQRHIHEELLAGVRS